MRRRGGADPASDPFERWNPLLEQAGLLGEVRATLLVADDVTRVLGRLRDQGLVRALTPLAALHGVLSARRWSGSLLALGTLEPADTAALSEATDRLCEAVMEQLPLLVEVFDEYGDRPGVAPAPPAATLTWTLGSAS
ncbi:acyl-CoA dehydrogenase [Streptomyces microflavus]